MHDKPRSIINLDHGYECAGRGQWAKHSDESRLQRTAILPVEPLRAHETNPLFNSAVGAAGQFSGGAIDEKAVRLIAAGAEPQTVISLDLQGGRLGTGHFELTPEEVVRQLWSWSASF